MKIKWKMTLWNTILMVILAAIILFFMLYITSAVAERSAESILKSVIDRNQYEVWYGNGKLRTFDFEHFDDGAYLQVYDKEGQLLEGIDPWELDAAEFLSDEGFRMIEADGDKLYLYSVRVWADDWKPRSPGSSGEPDASGEPD